MGKIAILLALPFLLILLARFSGGGSGRAATTHPPPTPSGISAVQPSSDGLAPNFSLPKLGGGIISLADYRGNKPVIVDFWASWCPNCRRDMPKLSRWYEQYRDRVEVIGVNLQEGEGAISRFVSGHDIAFPIALDPEGDAASAYAVRYTNTHVLIGRDGRVRRVIPGDIREADILSLLEG